MTMSTHRMFVLTVVAVLLSGGIAWAAGGAPSQQPQAQYSADSSTETAEITFKEKVYVAAGKQRKEQDMGGSTQISIIRMDKGVMWMLMPDEKMYMEMSLQQAQSQDPGVDLSAYQMERTEAGQETINGHQATKYKIIMTSADGTKLGGFQWVVSPGIQIKLDALSKSENSKERIKMELTNLKIGKQDPALFEIPEGYTKMTMPSLPGMGMKGLMENVPGFGR
jgi:outer membrane lipoprotein-sorting protein